MFHRYISEDFGGVALHPIDLLDASTGRQVAQLTDPNLETICPVNKPHPRQNIIVSGSSRSLYAWKPTPQGRSVLYTDLPDSMMLCPPTLVQIECSVWAVFSSVHCTAEHSRGYHYCHSSG